MPGDKLHFIHVMQPTDPSKAVRRDGWSDYDHETFDLHWAHLERARDAGKLVLAGHTLDPDGNGPAIVIFEADSPEEAQRFFDAEPFVRRGFCTARLHPFSNPLMRNEL